MSTEATQSNVISFTDLLGEDDILNEVIEQEEKEKEKGKEKEGKETEDIEFDNLPPSKEEVVEVKKEEEEKKVVKETNSQISSFLKKRISSLIDSKKWNDYEVELEDGRSVVLSEIPEEDLTPELYSQIEDSLYEATEAEKKEKFIDKSKLPSVASKLVELAEKGGDITDAIKVYDDYIKPFENVNISDPRVQERIVREDLKSRNIEQDIVDSIVEKYKKDLKLDEKANEVVSKYNAAFDKYLTAKKAEAEKQKEETAKQQKIFKEELEKAYDSTLDNATVKKLVKLGTIYDQDGKTEAEKKVAEILKDPKETSELLMFLFNKETYINYKSNAKNREKDLKVLAKLNLIPKTHTAGKSNNKVNDETDVLNEMKFE